MGVRGLGGGGQFAPAIKKIIDAESQPIRNLESRKKIEDAKLKLLQEFKGKFLPLQKTITELKSFRTFRELKVDLGDGGNLVSVTVDKEVAEPGAYQLEVGQLASRSSIISNGFTSAEENVLGIGFIVLPGGNGEDVEVFIDEEHANLRSLAQTINADDRMQARAAVVKDMSNPEAPWKLILSAKNGGEINNIDFPDFYFLDGEKDFYIADNHESTNALLSLDEFEIESETNEIANFLPGVNLNLKSAKPGQPFTIKISEDSQKMTDKLKLLVEQINGVLEFIIKQNQVDKDSDTRTMFTGDTILQNMQYRLNNIMHEGFYGAKTEYDEPRLVQMNELGVNFDKNGLLTFKADKFQKILETDFKVIADAITGPYGFANQFDFILKGITRPGEGSLALREQSLRQRLRQIDDNIDTKKRWLERREQALIERFGKLEGVLAGMQQQAAFMGSAMSGSGDPLTRQLLGG